MLVQIAAGVCALLAPAFVLGVQPALASVPAAGILVAATYWRAPELLRRIRMPWLTVLGICVLFVVIDAALRAGLEAWLRTVVGHGTGAAALFRVSGIGALTSNGINNLPAYLALEPTVTDSPTRLAALLIGVNAGPIVTMWGSVATLLWASRCRSAGLTVDAGRIARTGALCAVAVVAAATLALAADRLTARTAYAPSEAARTRRRRARCPRTSAGSPVSPGRDGGRRRGRGRPRDRPRPAARRR